uniref:Uncharacterized protein n=1 Tax=Takifugu rubripes TaxID=31033 RepID=A0A674PNX0_TAKRU
EIGAARQLGMMIYGACADHRVFLQGSIINVSPAEVDSVAEGAAASLRVTLDSVSPLKKIVNQVCPVVYHIFTTIRHTVLKGAVSVMGAISVFKTYIRRTVLLGAC